MTAMPEPVEARMIWKGPVGDFLLDDTEQVDLEGAIRSGKTTAALRKVLRSVCRYPGINWLICRYSDGDTASKLRPVFEKLCVEGGVPYEWHSQERYYKIANGSMVYAFGLKA